MRKPRSCKPDMGYAQPSFSHGITAHGPGHGGTVKQEKRKGYRRNQRVGDVMQQIIAEAIERRVDDPRVGFVTVSHVDAAPDLKTARVYVSVLEVGEANGASTIKALNEFSGLLQREVALHLRTKFTPRLTFVEDAGPARADHISRLLDTSGQSDNGEEGK